MQISDIPRARIHAANVRGRTTMTGRIDHTKLRFVVREETFGERLRRLRIEQGLSQAQLGIDRKSVTDYEHGRWHPPVATLVILADALGTSLDYLFLGRGTP